MSDPEHATHEHASSATVRFRWTPARWARVLFLSALAGMLSGLAATAVELGLHALVPALVGRFTHLGGGQLLELHVAILLLPAVGGLASGLLVAALCPADRNGGTEAVVRAFHRGEGRLQPRVPAIKALANVVVIAFGGSAGPEGPIAGLGAALGSTLAGRFNLGPRELRVFLLAGCAGGVSAMFRSPLGGALFATTIPYFEPENEDEALVPAVIAAVTSYATFMAFWGSGHPLLTKTWRLAFSHPFELGPYLVLAVTCAGVAGLFKLSLDVVTRLRWLNALPRFSAPAVGGLVTGAIACLVPQVMDARYLFLQGALDSTLQPARTGLAFAGLCALVIVAKCVATAFTLGSGNSGGQLGPSVFMGGVTGAMIGALVEALLPDFVPPGLRGAMIPVGMAGVLAVTMRVPLACAVMVSEITGTYRLIVPLLFVSTIAYIVGRRFGLNHEQVGAPADSPAHSGREVLSVLETSKVEDVLEPAWAATADTRTPVYALRDRAGPETIVVLDGRRFAGMITPAALAAAPRNPDLVASHVMTAPERPIRPGDDLVMVLDAFHATPSGELPVVARDATFVGMVRRASIPRVLERWAAEGRARFIQEHRSAAALDQEQQLAVILARLPADRRGEARRVPVPADAVGRSLRAADFRKTHGLDVIAIQTARGDFLVPPDPDRPLLADDVLLVLGASPANKAARS